MKRILLLMLLSITAVAIPAICLSGEIADAKAQGSEKIEKAVAKSNTISASESNIEPELTKLSFSQDKNNFDENKKSYSMPELLYLEKIHEIPSENPKDRSKKSDSVNPISTETEEVIFSENFEGAFPGNTWEVGDSDPLNDDDYWDDVSCGNPCQGSWHGWCAAHGDQTDCSTYDNHMSAYMTSPLIDISGHTNVQWRFNLKYELEQDYDHFTVEIYGSEVGWNTLYTVTGSSDGWPNYYGQTTVNIPNGYSNQIKIRYIMTSDFSITRAGVFLDDIVITGDNGGTAVQYWAKAWVDSINGIVHFGGDNPGGNGLVSYQYAYVSNPSWPGFYIWRINNASNEPGWVDYAVNCIGEPDSVKLSWHGHATTSNGQNYTYLYLEVNGNVIADGEDFQPNNSWTTYYTIARSSYLNNGTNHFRVGCSESSSTFYAVRWIRVDLFYTVTSVDQDIQIPQDFVLCQNYPNPFNAMTTIKYDLPMASVVNLEIYDLLGRKIATIINKEEQAGFHQAVWNANDFASGVYFYKLQAGDFQQKKKMILMK